MDGVIPTEEFMEEEFFSLRNEHMVSKIVLAYLYYFHLFIDFC